MEVNKEKIWYILQFFFDKGENANQVAEIVGGVYGIDTVTANYVQFWFRRFRSGIFDVKDAPRTGRPIVENVTKITEIFEVDRLVSNSRIVQELRIDYKTVLNHLRQVGFKKKLDVWVTATPINTKIMRDRILICEASAKRKEIDPFLKRMLDRLTLAIDQKLPEFGNRKGVVFHQDNGRPHMSVVTHHKLWKLGWEVLMHPPYSPDLAPSDYHLFPALQNFLSDKKLGSKENCENR
ncbi:histone-lysine N-methyltransferase SETMAR [Trichonephila clavipes]|uniref:Histone-lysine N-methyltransferase SETMAR n=1 Tax=Trichonephila clavipes TaxID=2585209 RepID=A0A8X6VB46_TRICX|nr:histone-lysine N-methyltransferase SETMAR [Trichonephila clavipes]